MGTGERNGDAPIAATAVNGAIALPRLRSLGAHGSSPDAVSAASREAGRNRIGESGPEIRAKCKGAATSGYKEKGTPLPARRYHVAQ